MDEYFQLSVLRDCFSCEAVCGQNTDYQIKVEVYFKTGRTNASQIPVLFIKMKNYVTDLDVKEPYSLSIRIRYQAN